MVFIFFIIINNINSISLDNSNRKQNMNYQKFCKNNPNNFYCVRESFLYTIFIINSILIFIACVYILIIIVRKRIRENQIRTIYLITNTINNNYELKKKIFLKIKSNIL